MRVYFKIEGGHVHCRIFTTGSMCGRVVFALEEWDRVRRDYFSGSVQFIGKDE